MKHRRVFVFLALLILFSQAAIAQAPAPSSPSDWLSAPEFWIALAANIAGTGLFLSRVHALATGNADATTWGLGYSPGHNWSTGLPPGRLPVAPVS